MPEEFVETIMLPVAWRNTDNIRSRYATSMTVQVTEYEATITFFEAQPPLLTGTPEENKATLAQMKVIPGECVAKVVISPKRLQEFVDTIQVGLNQYLQLQHEQEKLEGSNADDTNFDDANTSE
jgi:hypothetical protein